jgi:hypothetical protein
MFTESVITIFDIIAVVMMVGIIVVYGLASYWNIKFLLLAKWQSYSWIKMFTAIMCIVFAGLYSYSLIQTIIGVPIDVSLFGFGFVRPSLFLLGGALASSARSRCVSLLSGGENWTLRKTL